MNYFIPIGTDFFPYDSDKHQAGVGRKTTLEIEFEMFDILDTLHIENPDSGDREVFYLLSLDQNSSSFDSYIVAVDAVIESQSIQ